MAQPHGTRALGDRHIHVGLAGSALAEGDLVQSTEATGSETIDNAATNVAVAGFTLEAIASAATGQYDRLRPGDWFWVNITTGTMAAAEVGMFADIVNERSITLTESNNDCRIRGWDGATTNFCIVEFGTPESATPTVLA